MVLLSELLCLLVNARADYRMVGLKSGNGEGEREAALSARE